MDLQDLRIFSRVAAVQNLTSVGHELGLTPGTVSKRLQALEDDLQVRLFDRTTRSVRITAEGERFLQHVNQILDDLEKARASVGDYAARPQGVIRICAPNSLGRYELGPALAAFLHRYPAIDMMVDLCGQPGGSLLGDGFDMAIRIGEQNDSALKTRRIGTADMILVASPKYLEKHNPPKVPADLAEHSCLLMGECQTAMWSFVDRRVPTQEVMSVRVSGRIRSNGVGILARCAAEGHGIIRCPEVWVENELATGRVVRVLPDFAVKDDLGIYAVYPGNRHLVPRVRVLVDFLAEWFRDARREDAGKPKPVAMIAAE